MQSLKAYVVLAAAVVMQTCLGGIYAWSVFAAKLQQPEFGFSPHQTALIFGTAICVFTASLVLTGPLQDRYGPRLLSLIAGLLVGAGYLTASVAGGNFWLWWLGIGLLNGLAVGFGYVCPIATATKWFPRHKGLIAGLAVAGYGGSAILLANVAKLLFDRGWQLGEFFRTVGIVYGATVALMALLMFLPEPIKPHELTFRRRTLLADRRFWLLFAAFFCSAAPAQTVIGHLASIAQSFGVATIATLAVSAYAVGNASGRILVGLVYDRLGGRRSIVLEMSLVAAAVVALVLVGHTVAGFLTLSALIGFCYGGNFAIYAPEAARLYGVSVLGKVYSLLLLSHGLAALAAPPIAGWFENTWNSYTPGLLLGAGVAVAGLTVFTLMARSDQPVLLPQDPLGGGYGGEGRQEPPA